MTTDDRAGAVESSAPSPTSIMVLALGGTIAMQQHSGGGGATLSGDEGTAPALPPVPGLALMQRRIADVPSASVQPRHLQDALAAAREAVDAGAAGIVLTHGTDTLEETAFLLSLWWEREQPLVLTGAMRPANAPGADGPANVLDALHTAAWPAARGLGVLVVLDGQVHLPDRVTKASSRSVGAFASEPGGPLALLDGPQLRLLHRPPTATAPQGGALPQTLPRVPILTAGLGEDLELLEVMPEGTLDGLVIAGVGMGHVAESAMPRIRRLLDSGVPVVVATRIPSGGTSTHHYAYPGSEVDLLEAGAVMAGLLSPQKARLLLQVLLASGEAPAGIRERFAAYTS